MAAIQLVQMQLSASSRLAMPTCRAIHDNAPHNSLTLQTQFTARPHPATLGSMRLSGDRLTTITPEAVSSTGVRHGCRGRTLTTTMAWGGTLAAVRLIVQGKHMELTDSIKSYVEEKVGHAVRNHSALVREVDVRCSVRGGETGKGPKLQRCEVTIFTKKHGVVRAEEEDITMYAAIDEVSDKIARKLRKIKEKDGGHGRNWQMRGLPKLGELIDDEAEAAAPVSADVTAEPEVEDDVAEEPQVVRTKYFDVKPMTVDEAVEQIINVGHGFFAFRDTKTGEINILYERKHGGYGVIVPRSEDSWEVTGQNGSAN